MEHPVLNAIRRQSFEPLGWFTPAPGDGVPQEARFVILIGNAGPQMFRRFARERDPFRDTMDEWCRTVIGTLARDLDATAAYPFDKPPLPFLTWARRARAGFVSPLGLNIHPRYGLWHAFRAALLFPVEFDLPVTSTGNHPCEVCAEKPCLSACPVGAFSDRGYNVAACATHIASPAGQVCMDDGCRARVACPVGTAFRYEPSQMKFHMRAFRGAHS
ncbi:4Fe-4S dicluster domain-containing protein [soil metagenome]